MKTNCCTRLCLLLMISSLFVSSAAFSQRNRYHRDYYGHHHYPFRSYSYIRPFVSVHFGDYGYRYHHGYYYRPYGSLFQLVIPPFGFRITTLPFGYRSFYLGANPYYYYDGIFYRPYENEYEVVVPPLGAIVDELPAGSRLKVIDGEKYYELNGTFYREQLDDHNRLSYTVVGTDGVLNTRPGTNERVSREPQIGDRLEKLPDGTRAVIMNGEKLYSTASGLYYKEVKEGNKIYYELVGK